MIKLIGILVVIIGFLFRFNTLLVVTVAGIVTGLVAGIPFNKIIADFGQFFVTNRYMSLAIVSTLPIIGILERYGLKEQSEKMIKRVKNATAGRVMLTYLGIRELSAALGLNIGGHAQTVRPLVAPMAEGAATRKLNKPLPKKLRTDIQTFAACVENTGWFFGEDIFIATGAILLMKGFFESQGMHVGVWQMAFWGLPTSVCAFLISWFRLRRLDKRISLLAQQPSETSNEEA
ncbi:DUF969 domain-containing protein [Pullulanibacillus sp. KACC 23026]|uniref:DUF969 domain-containing protein n=1 Tax=Pullulanibacillus sp. KACC 23026 TaxID=3028315 RepID=UPI0023B064EF|nr:DUF969 domain-containing protein [Pullulanibacillus sp. KACC 23026]WEG14463.1 DUF969 domain-containing protein [Pullulanibacillus sp. KACC 23026]